MKFRSQLVFALFLVAAVLFASPAVFGQAGTSAIRGTVTDAQGGVIAKAQISIKNASGYSRSEESNSTGAFSFELIPVGDYQVTVQAAGFRKAEFTAVHALVGNILTLDVRLEVGSTSQVVQVESGGNEVQINTQDATLGNTIVNQQINQLPLEGRNVLNLLTLQPGVTPDGSVAGARSDQSNITLDGVDINDAQSNAIDGAVLRLNAEAIQEFRVTTVNSNADEGRSSAAQINLVTKSGSNQWHGAAFEFYRGSLFEANDWFSNQAGVPRTKLVRNTFGGALGGPIWKDRLFFFYSYEGRREATAKPVTEVVPLPSLGQGILNYTYCADSGCNAVLPASLDPTRVQQVYSDAGINPAALSALAEAAAKYPANDTSQGDGINTGGFRFNAPLPTRLNSHFARFDWVINSKQNAFVRLNYISDTQADPVNLEAFPDTPIPGIWNHPYGIAVGHTWNISNNLVNNFHYGLTRQAFTAGGDSFGNDISFRFVFQPNDQVHSLSRVTPVHNIRDDLSWIHGKHVFQFGANIRKINNSRVSFGNAFANAVTNPSFYLGAGEHVSDTFQNYLLTNNLPGGRLIPGCVPTPTNPCLESLASITETQNAATAIIGRFSEYSAPFTFGINGSPLSAGVPTSRNFATQAYEGYVQDVWKVRPSLTLTVGLRYSLERPVYETQGFQVQPTLSLSDYFQKRLDAAKLGNNFSDPIVLDKSGPANGGKPMYNWDKNNFQPRVALAWSPRFSQGLFHSIFGDPGKSVIRTGFALTNDYYGQALAVDFDLNNQLGFTSTFNINANTFDTNSSCPCDGLGPLFTGFNQDVRSLPLVTTPSNLVFPLTQPSDEGERIESSIDSKLQAPAEYVWNLTYERQFKANTTLSVSYIGRAARHLLARRDVTAFNDVVDPKSGMDWYTAGTMLEKQRQQGINTTQIAPIPFFENLFPSGMASLMNDTFGLDSVCSGPNAGFDPTWSNTQVFYAMQSRTPSNPCAFFAGNDWTDTQALVDQVLFFTDAGPTRFMQQQYGALSAWSTIGNSFYNAMTVTVRQRMKSLTMDFNYTYSHSLDDASGLQSAGAYGSAFIVNPIRQGDWYGNSDFDIRHLITASAIWQLPFGRGRHFGNSMHRGLDAFIGGWQLSGIFRYNSGLPETTSPYDDARWATNWNVQADVTATNPISACPDRTGTPKLFGGCDLKTIYQSFRNAYPGETGPRNWLRIPNAMNADLGLSKSFTLPWSEKQELQLRWEVFNVANYQPFGAIDTSRSGFGVQRDPALRGLNPPSNWSNFTGIQGDRRVMQIGLRFSF